MDGKRWLAWMALAIAIALGLSIARGRRPAAPPADAMPLKLSLPERQEIQLGVYFAAREAGVPSKEDLLAAARSWIRAHAKDLALTSIERHLKEGGVDLQVLDREELPLRFDDALDALPDPARARKRFAEARHAVHVRSRGDLAPPCPALWAAWGAARGIAGLTGGLVYDPATYRFAREDSLTDDLPSDGAILITDHIVVPYSTGKDGLVWETTVGLGKFGLPNLESRDVPPHAARSIGALLNAVAQHLVARVLERPDARQREIVVEDEILIDTAAFLAANGRGRERPGVEGTVAVRVAYTPMTADGMEPFLTLLPPRGWAGDKSVWLHSLMTALEPEPDPVVPRPAGDPALARAREKAQSRLPEIKKRFLAGLAPGEALYVKHGFTGEGGVVEHMWLAVTSWEGRSVEGTLANNPRDITSLKGGQLVEVDETDVDDWILRRADGSREGGFSIEVFREDKKGR